MYRARPSVVALIAPRPECYDYEPKNGPKFVEFEAHFPLIFFLCWENENYNRLKPHLQPLLTVLTVQITFLALVSRVHYAETLLIL